MSSRRKWGWAQQWNAQRGLCWICLCPMQFNEPGDTYNPRGMSVEHIVPVSRGGGEGWHNKLLAHRICNSQRGAPFVWVPVRTFRRAAMVRIQNGLRQQTTVEGVDLGCSHGSCRAPKRSASTRRPVTVPSEMAGKALRVSLAELSSRGDNHP